MKKFFALIFFFGILFSSCEEDSMTKELLSGNSITSFTVTVGGVELSVNIDGTNVEVIAPYDISFANEISLEILFSENASIVPDPQGIKSLTEPVQFTITAENGEEKVYTVTVLREKSPENSILSFSITDGDELLEATIDSVSNTISKELPKTWKLTDLTAAVTISDYATIEPDPNTITDYTSPIVYTVKSEDQTIRTYEVVLSRLPFEGSDIVSFTVIKDAFSVNANIDMETKEINQRLPPNIDLSHLNIEYKISENASIEPNPADITDYSQPVDFMVTSESNELTTYTVVFETMVDAVFLNCDVENASKWFGGDSRSYAVDPNMFFPPRNVGTGNSLTPQEDFYITSYAIRFSNYFRFYDENGVERVYAGDSTVRLQLRDSEGNEIASVDNTFSNPMELFWITFDFSDLNLILKKDVLYYFSYFLVDGESLGINTGSHGNTENHSELCNSQGFSATSAIREETNLEDWDIWYEHPWHFNYRFNGLK